MTDNNPSRGDDGTRAEAEMKEREATAYGWQLVPTAALKWLNGEGPDHNGDWFGDVSGRGNFWWRKQFADMLSALPAPQGDDGLVGELVERLKSRGDKSKRYRPHREDCDLLNEAVRVLHSQAAEIAGLKRVEAAAESTYTHWRDRAIAAEARLAVAMEALEQISAGPMFAVTDVKRWAAWAAEIARTTLSSIKGESPQPFDNHSDQAGTYQSIEEYNAAKDLRKGAAE